jgi:hypothetical protein
LDEERLNQVHWLAIRPKEQVPKAEAVAPDDLSAPSVSMIEDLKILANKRDVPYQSLLKMFLAERLEKERRV